MMTPSLTNEAFAALGGPDLVYVREIKAKEVLSGALAEAVEDLSFDPDQVLFATWRRCRCTSAARRPPVRSTRLRTT